MSTFKNNKDILRVFCVLLIVLIYYINSEFRQVNSTNIANSTSSRASSSELMGGSIKNRSFSSCQQKNMCLSCVSKGLELEKLVNSTQNVILIMPAKAAGTSYKSFAKQCSGRSYSKLRDNFLNFETGENFLTSSFEPPVIASHMYKAETMTKLFQHASKDTLFIWSHREETSRLLSAIKHVTKQICSGSRPPPSGIQFLEKTNKKCVISESDLIGIIKKKTMEIGIGMERLLSCDTYDAMRTHLPNLILADYNEADEIQKHVAQRYCHELLKKTTVRENVASDFKTEMYVKLSKADQATEAKAVNHTVLLENWLRVKRSYIELSLELKKDVKCQDRTRRLEHTLDTCDDHIVQIDNDWIGR
ncbi:predicted protein [Chaetoceros tenuissimus]|uniref:Uncharacterized protein n=1 Tax=Chaetoceros tenuissimus TaxID=426638 RepID=A0AAD3H8K5_9STRA|nr:predicted protein [Chaetoceros tenuissimus]